jgi:hypothetical protein
MRYLLISAVLWLPFGLPAQTPDLIGEIRSHSEVMANLAHLCDRIGPRVTGSPNLDQAARWVAQKLRDYGAENVALEYNQIHHSQIDTIDHVREGPLVQGAQVLAVWAYNVAQLPQMLPRKPKAK